MNKFITKQLYRFFKWWHNMGQEGQFPALGTLSNWWSSQVAMISLSWRGCASLCSAGVSEGAKQPVCSEPFVERTPYGPAWSVDGIIMEITCDLQVRNTLPLGPVQPKEGHICLSLRHVAEIHGGGCPQCKINPVLLEKGGACKAHFKVSCKKLLNSLKTVFGPFRGKNNLQ